MGKKSLPDEDDSAGRENDPVEPPQLLQAELAPRTELLGIQERQEESEEPRDDIVADVVAAEKVDDEADDGVGEGGRGLALPAPPPARHEPRDDASGTTTVTPV